MKERRGGVRTRVAQPFCPKVRYFLLAHEGCGVLFSVLGKEAFPVQVGVFHSGSIKNEDITRDLGEVVLCGWLPQDVGVKETGRKGW